MKISHWPLSKKIGAAAGVGACFVLVAFGGGALVASAQTFETFPQQFFIGSVDVGGATAAEAFAAVQQRAQAFARVGQSVSIPEYGTYTVSLPPDVIEVQQTIAKAKGVAQRGAIAKQLRELVGADQRVEVPLVVSADAMARATSEEAIARLNVPLRRPVNARYEIGDFGVRVVAALNGHELASPSLADAITRALQSGGAGGVTVAVHEREPDITTPAAQELLPQQQALAAEITKGRSVMIEKKSIPLAAADLTALLQPRLVDGSAIISIDPGMLKAVLQKQLAPFEQEGKNAVFEFDGKKVTKFVAPQKGISVDWERLASDLFASLSTDTPSVAVHTKETEPTVTLGELNNLGLKEIIGIGRSNFSGSPKNRRHNIATGVASLRNILIAPGQEFSLIKALGTIDGSTGYLQELVIKENKTIPEFGGGLCQIGTTTFRAAMGAGFPIVERRNHSYQVRYYFENGVSGTDATIYDPKPDFRFKNDTANWVLFDPRIKGDTLEFVFWGTSDGRVAKRTIPKILSTAAPPPKKMIETLDLPPGQIKCTEKPHAGASTIFTYTVAYADGTTKKQDFSSYYKPWGEVCLIGVAAFSTPPADGSTSAPDGATAGAAPVAPAPSAVLTPDAAGATGN